MECSICRLGAAAPRREDSLPYFLSRQTAKYGFFDDSRFRGTSCCPLSPFPSARELFTIPCVESPMSDRVPDHEELTGGLAESQNSSRWFYVQHGEMYGPVSSADLRAAAHLGFLGPDDVVRREDGTDWVHARSLRGLFRSRK
jgi:hypothetical protein